MKITEFTSQLNILLDNYEKVPEEVEIIDKKIKTLVDSFVKEETESEEILPDPDLGNRIKSILPRFVSNPRIYLVLNHIAKVCLLANVQNGDGDITNSKLIRELKTLKIDGQSLDQLNLDQISLEQLERLTIKGKIYIRAENTEPVTKFLERAGRRVTRLELTATAFTPSQVIRILRSCNQIESLDLDIGCFQLADSHITHFLDQIPVLEKLKKMHFLGTTLPHFKEDFFNAFKELENVNIDLKKGLTQFPISLQNLPKLKECSIALDPKVVIPSKFLGNDNFWFYQHEDDKG